MLWIRITVSTTGSPTPSPSPSATPACLLGQSAVTGVDNVFDYSTAAQRFSVRRECRLRSVAVDLLWGGGGLEIDFGSNYVEVRSSSPTQYYLFIYAHLSSIRSNI